MFFYQLDYVVDEVKKSLPTAEQAFLKEHLNKDYSKKKAAYLWVRIVDHKWYIGERLKRDVGYRVAAVDYVENFYDHGSFFGGRHKNSGVFGKISRSLVLSLRSYFVNKSKILPH